MNSIEQMRREEEIREKARYRSPNELLDQRIRDRVRQEKQSYSGK